MPHPPHDYLPGSWRCPICREIIPLLFEDDRAKDDLGNTSAADVFTHLWSHSYAKGSA